jgi:hypothetical protein
VGMLIYPCLVALQRYFPTKFKDLNYAFVIVGCVSILALLTSIALTLKKEAVPAKKSDFIGYAVILAFCASIYFIARAVIN